MGKTRDLFKKIRHTKRKFHAKMGSIKDRNCMGLTEADDIRRGGKNTQKNCTKRSQTNALTLCLEPKLGRRKKKIIRIRAKINEIEQKKQEKRF